VAAVLSYMKQRGPKPCSLFKFSNGRSFTRACFVTKVREALNQAGINFIPILWAQLQDWDSHNSSEAGSERDNYKDAWKMEE